MLLDEAPGPMRPVRPQDPHFKVFPEFKAASYAKRYEVLLTKLVRERLYDSVCFLLSDVQGAWQVITENRRQNFALRIFLRPCWRVSLRLRK